ncbi:TIGR02391 family protein [Branchiibius cervicis]|uniref:TIGR02391 family protein n=1 Tax=Branchiibius cervicis TaxID=908252 RepID=A0ABW2AVV1_9MICO
MTKLDVDWAVKELDAFLSVTAQVGYANTGGVMVLGTHMRGAGTEAAERAYVVELILDQAIPGWAVDRPVNDRDYKWLREQASRGKAALQWAAELRDRLGDGAPEMDAGKLHPWAWESASALWRTGHYHQAVMQTAIRVNAETQAKLGRRDISEVDLFNQAFSRDDPKPGAPRLRLQPDDGGDTYKNRHRGARAFADGLYSAIRNPGMHELAAHHGEEQVALEQLAAFSILARWVDEAAVETG